MQDVKFMTDKNWIYLSDDGDDAIRVTVENMVKLIKNILCFNKI